MDKWLIIKLNQTSTNPPTLISTDLNQIGTLVFSRVSTGIYKIKSSTDPDFLSGYTLEPRTYYDWPSKNACGKIIIETVETQDKDNAIIINSFFANNAAPTFILADNAIFNYKFAIRLIKNV